MYLHKDAGETPHVDAAGVGYAQHYLGRPVESRLYIGVDSFGLVAARAEVYHFEAGLVGVLEQDVLRLQVAVDDAERGGVLQGGEDLHGEAGHQGEREALEATEFDELVEVHRQQFEGDAEVVSE